MKFLLSPLNPTRGPWGHGEMPTEQAGKEKPPREKLSGQWGDLHRAVSAVVVESTLDTCETKGVFDWLIRKRGEIPGPMDKWALCSSGVKQSFLPAVFLPKEWKFPVFPPWQPSVLALTHYTCVTTRTNINPLPAGNHRPVDAGLLGLSLSRPHPCQPAPLIWPVMAEPHDEQGKWCVSLEGRVRMTEGSFSGWELFPKCQGLPVLSLPDSKSIQKRYVWKRRQILTSRSLLAWAPGRALGKVTALQKLWLHYSVR